MKKREFKVGDKVKIPKTKSKDLMTSLEDCCAIQKAKGLNQNYLYINRIIEDEYDLGAELSSLDSTFGLQDLEHYEEEFVLPKCWFVLYNTKEEFDIINKFYDKNWLYCEYKNKCGYHNNGDNQIHSNNWIGNCTTKEKLLKNGYIQITFEQFQKYILKQETMKKEIIGYKLNGKVTAEEAATFLGCAKKLDENGCFFWKSHFVGNIFLEAKRTGVLDLWFEPVYAQEFKVGDWVTVIEDSKGVGDNIKKGINYTFKIANIEQSFLYNDVWLISDKDNNNGILSGYCRKATKEEIDKARIQTIQMHSSNKGEFEIEVIGGKAYYRPENKELSKNWVASIIDVFDNKVYGLYEVPYIVSAQIKEVKVGCMEGTRREDWVKVYDLIK